MKRRRVDHPPVDERSLRLEKEVRKLRTVLRGTATLNSALNYERVMDLALDLATSALADSDSSAGLVSALLMYDGETLKLVSSRGFLHADQNAVIPGRLGVVEQAMSSGQLQVTDDPQGDPELGRLLALRRCSVAVCIPLVVGLEVYGIMLFGHSRAEELNEEGIELVEAIAQQAIVALQNARLYGQLEQEKERMAEIQEEARHKLARDLHDGPAQSIGAIAMRVNFARRLVARDPKKASDELFKIEELARRTSKEIRQMLFTLRPLILESEGLMAALKDLSRKFEEMHHQKVHIDVDPQIEAAMEVGKQGVVFFLVEEAVNNARKHAKAEHIWVRLQRAGDLARLEIEDNGTGFDVSAVQENYDQRGSLGMVNLHERAEMVNGTLKIESAAGQGTRISVEIPMTVEAAERRHRIGGLSRASDPQGPAEFRQV
ncbi:MAG: histidine kinase, partial [Anaerolineales bacterium]